MALRLYSFIGNNPSLLKNVDRYSDLDGLDPASSPKLGWTDEGSVPYAGYWKKGDIIFNTLNNGVAGWVCVEDGEPGTWEVLVSAPESYVPVFSEMLFVNQYGVINYKSGTFHSDGLIADCTKTGVGVYNLTFLGTHGNAYTYAAIGSLIEEAGRISVWSDNYNITVKTYDSAGAPKDSAFSLFVRGE